MANLTADEVHAFGLVRESSRVVLATVFVDFFKRDTRLLDEYLRGAHFVLCGKKSEAYYLRFKELEGSYPRPVSSHFSSSTQVCVPQGYIMDSLLVGTISSSRLPKRLASGSGSPTPGMTCSWIQLEGAEARPGSPVEFVLHSLNFVQYLFSGMRRNIGPCGSSNITEAIPYVITLENEKK